MTDRPNILDNDPDAPATGSTAYAPKTGSTAYAAKTGSTAYAPKTGSTAYPASTATWLKANFNSYPAVVWDDLRVPLTNAKAPASTSNPPDFAKVTGTNLLTWRFSGTQQQELYFAAQLPHRYKDASEIRPHIHWISTSSTGKVVWGCDLYVERAGEAMSTMTVRTTSATPPGKSTAGQLVVKLSEMKTSTGGRIPGTGVDGSDMIWGRLFRDSTNTGDTRAAVADALEVDFHFQSDRHGSSTEYP